MVFVRVLYREVSPGLSEDPRRASRRKPVYFTDRSVCEAFNITQTTPHARFTLYGRWTVRRRRFPIFLQQQTDNPPAVIGRLTVLMS